MSNIRLRQTHPISGTIREIEVEEVSGTLAVSEDGSTLRLELGINGDDPQQGWCAGPDGAAHAFVWRRVGEDIQVWLDGRLFIFERATPAGPVGRTGPAFAGDIPAPMPGRVVQVLAAPGQRVDAGDPLVIMESMKMELVIDAPSQAVVRRVAVAEGDQVDRGMRLLELEQPGGEGV